jgi:hypothetical protein
MAMDDQATKKHRLLLDLLALEAEFIRVMKLNSEPPHIPENDVVSRDLIAARDLVKALIAKLQK